MQQPDEIIQARAAILEKIAKLNKEIAHLKIELKHLQLDCPHTNTSYDSGWGRMPDTTCNICGKVL